MKGALHVRPHVVRLANGNVSGNCTCRFVSGTQAAARHLACHLACFLWMSWKASVSTSTRETGESLTLLRHQRVPYNNNAVAKLARFGTI